jgi:hypothetical protein
MSSLEVTPTGHLQVIRDSADGPRIFKAFITDANGKRTTRLGPAHVKATTKRTARNAVVWRAGDGPKPSPLHLTPKEAEAKLADLLAAAPRTAAPTGDPPSKTTLRQVLERYAEHRAQTKGLRRSTATDYDWMFGRLCRDLGWETDVRGLTSDALVEYFASFSAERVIGADTAQRLSSDDEDVAEVVNHVWLCWPAGEMPIEVATKHEAEAIATERGWTWKHRARGVYRVTPPGAKRGERVTFTEAARRRDRDWDLKLVERSHWVHRTPAAPQTHNEYRDILSAALELAIADGKREEPNPVDRVPRASRRADRQRILRREDFYDKDQANRLLAVVEDDLTRTFFRCGFHAGLRLPGEGLGLRWGNVDFDANVLRPHDNWVRGVLDDPKTIGPVPIPMIPSLRRDLLDLKRRGWRTADDDFVFLREETATRPVDERDMRDAFRRAVAAAELKPIPMYNARHSFGTQLARKLVPSRTIQGLMRHARLSTTEMYMAYAPQPDLERQITVALEDDVGPAATSFGEVADAGLVHVGRLLAALADELPPKWMHEVERVLGELAGVPSGSRNAEHVEQTV